ncbi:TPR-like protein [Peniophora sp. CONT]|nr:TPR-like protein [Peniophora sp. CONT]
MKAPRSFRLRLPFHIPPIPDLRDISTLSLCLKSGASITCLGYPPYLSSNPVLVGTYNSVSPHSALPLLSTHSLLHHVQFPLVMDNDLSTELTLPDAKTSLHLLEATTFDHVPLDNPRGLGDFMWALYKKRQPPDASLLDEAIQATQIAVDLEQEQDVRAQLLFDLGVRLDARSKLKGSLDDLGRTISAFKSAVELTPDGDPTQIIRLNRLGVALLEHFQRIGDVDELNAAITAFCCAVEFAPDVHPGKPALLSNYGASLQTRFKRLGELEDIKCAIAILRRANELVWDGHPGKPQCSNNLANALISRFEITGELEDLEQAISSHRRAIELTPDDHPDKPLAFNNLGNSFLARFERTGELEDLEQAISTYRRAVELIPDGHPNKVGMFNNLGNSFRTRFEHTGQLEDLEQAISTHRRAVELTPDGHPDKPSRFSNLGNSFLTRFERTGELQDLEQAISSHRRAIELTPDGHPDNPAYLNNLGGALLRRFERTGELEDLEQAILSHRRAVELTPDGHPDKPARFNNLGGSLMRRYERTGELNDLEQAISSHRRALELTADDHPEKPGMLTHLCQDLRSRFERTQEPADIQEAISAGDRAIELSPEGHSELYVHYCALAGCFQRRFEHSGDILDIRKAISLVEKATEVLSDSDPRLSGILENLGCAQRSLFERTQTQADFDVVVESFTRAVIHVYGSPSDRFDSARRCARMLSDNPAFSTADSLLSAHSRVIAILPEIVWLGHGIHRRYEESSQLGELVNAAVSAAVATGALEQAVEWLEAGRALIWSQVLALRTPLDELQDSHPELAESFRSVQQRLQSTAHATFAPDIDGFGGITGLTVNSAADSHRKVAIEYDRLMKEIRQCLGYQDFLLPRTFDSLVPSSQPLSGPVVFINASSSRCDALLLSPEGDVVSVELPDLSLDKAIGLCNMWIARLVNRMGRERGLVPPDQLGGFLNPFTLVLEQLWEWIVCPVLVALDLTAFTRNGRLPHVTWCPTGPLAYLPLHAAGIYRERLGPRVFDFVVSSYTPSLTALLRACSGVEQHHATPEVLLVTQPATPDQSPLPGTARESAGLLRALATSDIRSTKLDDKDATVSAVRRAMSQHPWVHLACHGSQEIIGDPTQSAFMLYDGRLSLADLMGTVSDDAELAFLSACQTAVGNLKNPDDSAHLTAGMLAVGFKGVVGTTWSIRDDDAPIVVEAFYKELLALRSTGTLGKGETGAAYALHEATRVLREQVGENSFMRWVPFVHFGV